MPGSLPEFLYQALRGAREAVREAQTRAYSTPISMQSSTTDMLRYLFPAVEAIRLGFASPAGHRSFQFVPRCEGFYVCDHHPPQAWEEYIQQKKLAIALDEKRDTQEVWSVEKLERQSPVVRPGKMSPTEQIVWRELSWARTQWNALHLEKSTPLPHPNGHTKRRM